MTNISRINYFKNIICRLKGKKIDEKNQVLSSDTSVQKHFKEFTNHPMLKEDVNEYLLKCLILIGGHEIALSAVKNNNFQKLLLNLKQIDDFFLKIEGIIGYQHKILSLLQDNFKKSTNLTFHSPFFVDISKDRPAVRGYIQKGIEMLDQMGEIYVVGGAADRLHLLDEKKHKRLPAAMMKFCSKTLLRRLIEDVEAKEHLYEKITGKKTVTPIAMMCSNENDNFDLIKALMKRKNYFNRPKDSFFFFMQPSVPVVTENGKWVESKPGELFLKPSGHGALWKLAKDKKLFEWFFEKRRKKVLVRQINNPIAGIDSGLLAFTGYGLKNDSDFGFASCPRQVHSAEGVNVLVEKKQKNLFEYVVTNIEYCEFEKFKIEDRPIKENEQFSKFSSNTNLLFVDLKKVEQKIDQCPYPGMLINFKPLKTKFSQKPIIAGRLETTMQNIADVFTETSDVCLKAPYKLLKTFVSYNARHKTISTTKRVYDPSKNYLETPEKCFYDFMKNGADLLKNYCLMQTPNIESFESFIDSVPPFLFSYHPALGPLYSVIAQKLKGGYLQDNSELVLDIAELFCENLQLEGSLRLFSSDLSANCFLKNVSVKNAGVDFASTKNYWKGNYSHIEKCDIYLGKGAVLIASNIELLKNQSIVVPDNQVIEIVNDNGKNCLKRVKKNKGRLAYGFSEDLNIEVAAERNIFFQPQISI